MALVPLDQPLGVLANGLFFGLLALGRALGQDVPDITPEDHINGGEAITIIQREFGHLFPGLSAPVVRR